MEDLKTIGEGLGVEGETEVGQGVGEGGQEPGAGRDQGIEEERGQEVAGEKSQAQDAGTGQGHETRVNPDQSPKTGRGQSPNLEKNLGLEISLDLVINLSRWKNLDHGISPDQDQRTRSRDHGTESQDQGTRSRDHRTESQDQGTRSPYREINQDRLVNPSPDPGQVVVMTKTPSNSFRNVHHTKSASIFLELNLISINLV